MRTPVLTKSFILNPNPERQTDMKKYYLAFTVLAAALLVSCERELSFDDIAPLKENEIAFILNSFSTRSAATNTKVGVTIPMGKTDDGEAIFLEETIEELNANPLTKGAPAYTQNVGTLYSTMGVYSSYNGEDVEFGREDSVMHDREEKYGEPKDSIILSGSKVDKGWRYLHSYSSSPWPDESTNVDFYLRMPADPDGVTNLIYANKKITFDFESQATAEEQQDILFAQTSISKARHQEYAPKGAPVMMYHALAGVKFRSGWDNATGTKTIITGVRWKGLKKKGTCTVDPNGTTIVSWTVGTDTLHCHQAFTNEPYSSAAGVDGTVDFSGTDTELQLPNTSWTSAAADHNLNNGKGEWTFWFVPQEIDDNVTLEVTFLVKTADTPNGKETITHTINFGEKLNEERSENVKWEAGQLRTYTLKPIHVDVDVYDSMDSQKYVKSNLHITNTGNVDQYVRVYIIGNWVGKRKIADGTGDDVYEAHESILMGYTDNALNSETGEYVNHIEVARWNDKDFTWSGAVGSSTPRYDNWDSPSTSYTYTPYGTFVGLPEKGTSTAPGRSNGKNWLRHDKFYYYTNIIGPGGRVPATDPLFESYTIGPSPDFWIADMTGKRQLAKDVHFVMDIAVQAIPVPYNGNTAVPYDQAWADALGVTVQKLNDL